MHKAVINGKTVYVRHGTPLSQVLRENGAQQEMPCGGKGKCKKCAVTVNGRQELSCRYTVNSDIVVVLPENGELLSESGAVQTGRLTPKLCFALDIGTTTLALALVSVDEGAVVKAITRANPQRIFGADVISRIEYCRTNGVKPLEKRLIDEINSMLDFFEIGQPLKLFVAGNTTMLHTFFGADCSAMGVAPYTPAFLASRTQSGEALGLRGVEQAESLPCVSAFVGADAVAGLCCTGIPEKGCSLLVDLGTNAEVMLFGKERVLCTSAAAGPCFEGAEISCGMSATDGAVYSFDGQRVKTVGNLPAKGICGTGLVDVIAYLLGSGGIDSTGFLGCGEFEVAQGVCINQEDVRKFQLAKSAVCSAVLTLLEKAQLAPEELEKVYISGGFSAQISVESAVKTGLLPRALAEKCVALNNSSLLGTVKYACGGCEEIVRACEYVDLSTDESFSRLFIENMMF